jgi:hypothetical protein
MIKTGHEKNMQAVDGAGLSARTAPHRNGKVSVQVSGTNRKRYFPALPHTGAKGRGFREFFHQKSVGILHIENYYSIHGFD